MKKHEMIREIMRMGFEVRNGRKHYIVVVPATGELLGVLPRGQNAYGGGRNGIALLSNLRRWVKLNGRPDSPPHRNEAGA